MPQFAYYGRDAQQQPVRGTLEASSPANVVDWLAQTGVTPISIEPVAHVQEAGDVLARLLGRQRVTLVELMMITRQLYALTKAGVPIMRALRGLEQSTDEKHLKRLFNELHAALESGVDLSQALARRPDVFI